MKTAYVVTGVVVGVVVVVAIVVPCVLLIPGDADLPVDNRPVFDFEDLWSSKYSYKSIYPSWDKSTTDDQLDFLQRNDASAIVRRKIDNPYEDIAVLVPATFYTDNNCNGYSVSADAKFAYCRLNYMKVWRHSYTADYVFYDIENKMQITVQGFPSDGQVQYIAWSPSGHKLAYVYSFDVYWITELTATDDPVLVSPGNGERNVMYYGIPDWMYEEEMISTNNVLYWSPNSDKVAFLQTDETGVELIKYTWYGDEQYPQTIEIAYPKAGTTIGKPTMWVFVPSSGTLQELQAPTDFTGGDYYFSRFTWKNSTTCLVTWTNRLQTKSIAQLCKQRETEDAFDCSHANANTETVNGGWVGSFGPFYPMWISGSSEHNYYTIYARDNAEKSDGFWQLALVEGTSSAAIWMTNTNYDIVGLTHYDEVNGYVYFTAAHDLPRRRQILRVKSTDRNVAETECMTCKLLQAYPDRCGWVSPVFNDDGTGVVINCRGPMVPLTVWMSIDKDGKWGEPVELETNSELQTLTQDVKWPVREYSTYQSTNYPDKAYNYEIWRPADFDETKKYPLLIEVYAGPEFQKVTDTWTKSFAQTYMVSDRDIIVASVDGRGSAYEGYKFMREAYLKLGQKEPEDQTDFAKHLINSHSYIDSSRVAIWGWSYGGYTTSHTLGYDGGSTFQCGIAVAPLGDWTWYDAMYAERYMQMPTDNSDGYTKASIIHGHDLNNFKKVSYTLIHGTADDNVHFQSAAQMEKALVEKDVDFDDFFYADQAHSINIGNANRHIYHQLDTRLSYCLGKVDAPYP